MGIFDRYLLRVFLRVLAINFLSFTGLYIVIDLFNNLDEFLSYGQRLGGLGRVLFEYYGARVLTFFDRTSAIVALVASLFVLAWMQRTNELTAIEASGISRRRVVLPLGAAVVVISLLGTANRELFIPHFQEQLARNAQDWLGETAKSVSPRYDNETDIYLSGRATIAKDQEVVEPSFRLPSTLGAFGRQLTAATARYTPAGTGRPSGYLLTGVKAPANIDALPSGQLNGRPVLLTRRDTDWLEPGQCFVVSRVDFEQLAGGEAWRRFSSSSRLIAALHNPSLDYGADVRVTIHSRIVQPLLDVLLFLIGLPLVFTRHGRNVFVAAGLCVLVVIAFFLVVLGCQSLGANYLLSPAFAAWCPVLVFAPVAHFLASSLWE